MRIEDQLRHARRVIADQAIQMGAMADALEEAQKELEAAKEFIERATSEQMGRRVEVAGTIVRAVEP